jgi:hypothetical protein
MTCRFDKLKLFPSTVILMNKIKLIAAISTALVCMFISNSAVAVPLVKVTAWGMHQGGGVVYKYRVQNSGADPIKRIFIGFYPPTDGADGAAELTEGPYYPGGTSLWLPTSVSQSPAGWGVYLSIPEESATFALAWVEAGYYRSMWPGAQEPGIPIAQNPPNIMPAGATWDQFSVTLPKPDYAYVHGHANLETGVNEFTIQMEKGDTTPPTLTVTLTPSTLPANGKHVPITATITAKDDYDPSPEIKLESITPSEKTEPGDIRDAHPGTDDRQFMLKAESRGKNKAARFYTVIYSATDASGNKATASATVTVAHDERGHDEHGNDDHRDDKDKKDKDDHKRDR